MRCGVSKVRAEPRGMRHHMHVQRREKGSALCQTYARIPLPACSCKMLGTTATHSPRLNLQHPGGVAPLRPGFGSGNRSVNVGFSYPMIMWHPSHTVPHRESWTDLRWLAHIAE